jgi:(p)ppGpp synthase/HD superfamily hydrolase
MISSENFNISRILAKEINSTEVEFELCVGVKNNKELEQLINKLKTIDAIKLVNRFFE